MEYWLCRYLSCFSQYVSIYSVATLLGAPVESNAIQYNSSTINFTFKKFTMFSFVDFVWNVYCKFSYIF